MAFTFGLDGQNSCSLRRAWVLTISREKTIGMYLLLARATAFATQSRICAVGHVHCLGVPSMLCVAFLRHLLS
jgi:hypothetical protein